MDLLYLMYGNKSWIVESYYNQRFVSVYLIHVVVPIDVIIHFVFTTKKNTTKKINIR